ncbi:microtubule-binding protein TANGLED1 [Curcuma longa]|uniref:microtubule-binding protein TANGLED1 n=1 Tax=Curcuma longa TaxID=136217 RepID=UPI003D9EF236
MVAKTPIKHRRFVAATSGSVPDSDLVRQTLNKVDRCVARLQELQYTVMGGAKVVSGVTLSPRSTRGYLRTSVRCKQESLRTWSNPASRRSPAAKFPGGTDGEWRRMSLPAMLLNETLAEIIQTSRVAKKSSAKTTANVSLSEPVAAADPKTPVATRRRTANKPAAIPSENVALYARRSKEKQPGRFRVIRSESSPVTAARARSRIRFKSTSPLVAAAARREEEAEEGVKHGKLSVAAHRVSPRHRPWGKKTVLFPNALFNSSSSSPPPASACRGQRFYKTKSPIIGRSRPPQTPPPHKFLIKSPTASLGSQLATRKPGVAVVRVLQASPEKVVVLKTRRRSFSPSKFINRVVSPLRTRIALPKTGAGLKQRPELGTPARIPAIKRT